MAAQWQDQGSYWANPERSQKLRNEAYGMMRFRQLTQKESRYGAKKGSTVDWTRLAKVTDAGGAIPENSPMPVTAIVADDATLTINEYGNALEWTNQFETFGQFDVRGAYGKRLKMDMAATIDGVIYTEMKNCLIKYTPTGTAAAPEAVWATDGTCVTASTRDLQMWDIYEIQEYLEQVLKADPRPDTGTFVGMINGAVAKVLRRDSTYLSIMQYADPKRLLKGQIDMVEGMSFVKETQSMARVLGSQTHHGECFFLGDDAIAEAVAMAPELRGEEKDFGRLKRICWDALIGFKLVWDADSAAAGKARMVHVTAT